jgi:hypothetical protein
MQWLRWLTAASWTAGTRLDGGGARTAGREQRQFIVLAFFNLFLLMERDEGIERFDRGIYIFLTLEAL